MVWADDFKYKVASTSVARTERDYFHRREALVTYKIDFGAPRGSTFSRTVWRLYGGAKGLTAFF